MLLMEWWNGCWWFVKYVTSDFVCYQSCRFYCFLQFARGRFGTSVTLLLYGNLARTSDGERLAVKTGVVHTTPCHCFKLFISFGEVALHTNVRINGNEGYGVRKTTVRFFS